MPQLLGPTNPVPGYDAPTVKVTPPMPGDTTIQNIVDPSRVVRPDQRTDQQDAGDATASYAARYESSFMTFLQRLQAAPDLVANFLQALQRQGTATVSSGISAGFAEEISKFMDFIQMDEGQLLNFLQNQVKSGTRFSGALFQSLRDAYTGTQSSLMKTEILQFLRRFSNYTSTPHLEEKLVRTVTDMTRSVPSRWGNPLTEIAAKLENGVASGDRAGNLRILRDQLFPLISNYVTTTHDHGRARALLSMLTLDVARYENGAPEPLLQSFRLLATNGALPEELSKLPDKDVLRLLKETDFGKAKESDLFAERVVSMTSRALDGEGGVEAQDAFRNIMAALLLNESVYMPIAHFMLPLNMDDNLMFSELWVDPDAEDEQKHPSSGGGGPATRVLIKMDIQSLGAFDVLINEREGAVNLSVRCPEEVAAFSEQISRSLEDILARDGLKPEAVVVGAMKRPLTISEVFPKLYERMDSINVKI